MCVLMGLEMIKTIRYEYCARCMTESVQFLRQVRLKYGVNVDMRIGVHTGSGIFFIKEIFNFRI